MARKYRANKVCVTVIFANAGKKAEAQEAYQKVVNDFGFGQCWDPKGWFWKPADAAQKKLAELSI